MAKQRNPNGMGSYKKRKDGRYQWTQKKDGKSRPPIYARSLKELQNKVKKIADLPVTNSNKLTVDEWFRKWLELYVRLKKDATYNQYKNLYEEHVEPVLGHRKIAGITTSDVQSVIAAMQKKVREKAVVDEDGNTIKPELKGFSTKTIKETIGVMRRGFDKAIKPEKLIAENPVKTKDLDIPIKQAKPRKVLSHKELHDLFKAMNDSRWIWAMRLLLVTGMRRGELLALKASDIDVENHRIVIDESNSSTGELGDTKSAEIHYVPLSKRAMEYLRQQRIMLEDEYNPILYNERLKKTGLLFPNKKGTMLRGDSFTTMVARYAAKAKIHVSPHMMRHTFVFFNRKFLSLKDLQYILGHDESTTTLDIYGDMLDDSSEETANTIDNVFDKIEAKITQLDEEKAESINKSSGKVIDLFSRRKSS